MATEGSPIDVSILEALIELRKQQAQVDQFCQRADERKEKVEAAVYTRVMADYARRRGDLDAQAAPLVTKAMVEYRKLRNTFDMVRGTQAAAKLDKEEIEFRHALGEVDDPVKAERLKEPERLIAETTSELAALDKLEALFGLALPGVDLEAALKEMADDEPLTQRAPSSGSVPAASGTKAAASGSKAAVSGVAKAASGTAKAAAGSAPANESGTQEIAALNVPSAGEEAVEFADDGDHTVLEQGGPPSADFAWPPVDDGGIVPVPIGASGPIEVGKPLPPPTPPSKDVEVEDRTFIVPEALLLSEADNGQAVNFRLTALTYIGRSEDNQLRLLDPGVSRRHVLVMATPGGYTIRDLGSQNGTYVNGTRVDESPLADGDRITIGEINLVFRGAPAAVSA
jgi:hypothetical protein